MLKNNIIAKRVMAHVKTKIADAQREYDLGVVTLQEDHAEEVDDLRLQHENEFEAMRNKHAHQKEKLITDCVEKVIGKLL